eukprot:scaffold88741_cov38-Tisochrysis_lutea.AAC.3
MDGMRALMRTASFCSRKPRGDAQGALAASLPVSRRCPARAWTPPRRNIHLGSLAKLKSSTFEIRWLRRFAWDSVHLRTPMVSNGGYECT